MSAGVNGNETTNGMRAFTFVIFLMFSTVICHYNDDQYPTSKFGEYYLDSEVRQEDIQPGFIVHSPLCQIPNISAYDESIKKYIFKWKEKRCSDLKPLTKVNFDPISRSHTIKVDPHVVSSYEVSFAEVFCCYSIVTRKYYKKRVKDRDDDRYNMSPKVCFTKKIQLPIGTEYIYVTCSSKTRHKMVYENVHLMVADKQPKYRSRNSFTQLKKYSVFLFGIDSISRLNFIRTLPKTMSLVEKLGWVPLKGYTKIGDNTFINLIAVLTGLTVDQLTKLCWKFSNSKLDDCPFIWKNFSEMSYITAYAEDCPSQGIFTFNNNYGFLNSPTDYYTRPIMMAANNKMTIKTDGGMEYCVGQYPQIEYLFSFKTEFIQRHQNRPHFSLFWANSYSHDELNMPTIMDERIVKFIEDIKDYLNWTIVVFFSDHGMRYGKIRETYVGWLEERMPFIYFGLPPSFKAAYPQKYKNLLTNRNRLTSPFDLHATLQEILYGRVMKTPKGCPMCQSLFAEVPWNRSCENAAIKSHWCTCSVADQYSSDRDPAILHLANVAIGSINEYLKKLRKEVKSKFRCAVLNFDKVISVRSRFTGMFSKPDYIITFQVKPSNGIFESTFHSGKKFDGVSAISRINRYNLQSSCVKTEDALRLFCFCVKE